MTSLPHEKQRKEVKEMNTLVIVLIAAVCLFGAYTLYGRWLANKWGIDPTAKTPAVVHEDGRDYVPTNGWTVFAHQFSSIAGAGPVTGAIQAAAFGWLPVLLWVLLGGIFFGAVTDFGALYASVKNDGKSMGMLIEKYIGKTGRKLFLLFCWLFCGIVIAAFADMVAGTFNAYGADGALVDAAQTNGAAGMVSIMFMVFAVVFGLIQKKFNFSGWKESVISIVFIVLSFVIGANLPIILGKAAWSYITFVYIFFAAVLPMWLLKQPRDHMTTFMFVAMIAGAVVGLVVMEHAEGWRKLFCNVYFSTFLTLAFGFLLTKIGYANIWPLFGSANQLLSALVLATLCVFLKVTGRSNKMLFPPLIIMLCVTFTALVQRLIAMVKAISTAASVSIPAGETTWGAVFIANGLQLILAVLLIVLGLNIVFHSFSAYKKAEHNSEAKI